jgi:predicted transcriptional regulator
MKRTLKAGIAPREVVVRYTRDVVAGRKKRTADDPDIWFTSVESFAKILSDRNRALLAMIAECRPESIDALAAVSGRAKAISRGPSIRWRSTVWCGSRRVSGAKCDQS